MTAAIHDIILIGPVAVGKSTVGKVLAERLGLPQVSMDDKRFDYYRELGYEEAFMKKIFELEGAGGVYRYWKVFDAYSVERLLADHKGVPCVIDMGGGSSVHEHDDQLERVKKALANHINVVLLLPHEDPAESIRFLDERTGWGGKERNINHHFLAHRSNRELATLTVYVAGRTPEDIATEIMARRRT
jgi:shikimate kinase